MQILGQSPVSPASDPSATKRDAGSASREPALQVRRLVTPLCFIVLGVACLDLLGWMLHIPMLTSFSPHSNAMKPNTAICLALLAAASGTGPTAARSREKKRRTAAACLAGLALIVSGGTLLEYLTSTSLELDTLVLRVPADHLGQPMGRMSLGTALCLALIALSMLLFETVPRFCVASLVTSAGIALSALVGFLFSAGPLFGVPWLSSMAVHTAFCVLSVSIVVLVSHPEQEPMASLLPRAVGEASHWLLPGVTALPILVALPAVIAMRRGFVDVGFTMAVVVVVLIGLQICILWRDSQVLYQAQQRRKQVESDLARSEHFAIVGKLSANISHEITNSLDTARKLLLRIDRAKSLDEAKDLASLAGDELIGMNLITSQAMKFHEEQLDSGLKSGPDSGLDSGLDSGPDSGPDSGLDFDYRRDAEGPPDRH